MTRVHTGLVATALTMMVFWTGCGTAEAPTVLSPGAEHVELPASLDTPSTTMATVEIATYNVNFGVAGDPDTVEVITELDSDVIFLQETNAAWEHALAPLATRYPHMAFRHCCNAGGLAVLSKLPFSQKEYVHPEGAWFPAWRVVVQTEMGPIQVVNVHLRPNISDSGSVVAGLFTTPAVREAEIKHYVATLDASIPAVFVGDFNEPADGLAVQQLTARGMRSALPEAGGAQHTWEWATSVGKIRKQFDHIVYDERLTLVDARVTHAGRSDHFPVTATLGRAQAPKMVGPYSIPAGTNPPERK